MAKSKTTARSLLGLLRDLSDEELAVLTASEHRPALKSFLGDFIPTHMAVSYVENVTVAGVDYQIFTLFQPKGKTITLGMLYEHAKQMGAIFEENDIQSLLTAPHNEILAAFPAKFPLIFVNFNRYPPMKVPPLLSYCKFFTSDYNWNTSCDSFNTKWSNHQILRSRKRK